MLRTPDTGAVLLCSVGVTAAAAVILAISLKKQRPKMVFQFLKKIFGGASEDGGGGGKAVTDDPDSGSKSQENGSSKAVVIEEEASQVSRTAEDAEALLTLNKWITLLDCFVGSWSEHLSKVQVMEALQERLLTVDPLTLGGDQCLPLVELKESSNVIDGGRCSKTTTMVATVLEVGDLLLFSSIASEAEASRRKTLELAYDYLLELRDLISTFKKAFYFTGNDQLAIVETLATKNGKMFQRTERVTGLNTFSASITLTNMAYFSEPSAPSKEAAARSVAHQACEYLRKIAQIGSAQLRNIYGSGGSSNQGSSISSKTVAKAPKQIETPSAAAAAAVGVVDVVDGGKKKNSSRVVPFTSTFSSATTATVSTSAQASTFKASTSKASTSNRASPSSSALPEVQLTSSLTDPKLIARWALLLENFSSVSCEKKSKWQTRREMEAKGPREATIFVRPFRETIKLEEGVEVGAGVEKINGDKEGDEIVLYWGIAEVAGLVKLRERGKDELDGKDNALTAMFRFLKLTIEMLRVFKRRHQTETGKTARGLVKALHGTYPALIEMKVEKKEVVVEGEEGEGGENGQKWTPSRRLFTVTIELLNVATFTATSSDKQAAREAASKALIELMFKMMGGSGSESVGGPASKVAGSGKPSLVEVAAPAAKKTAVPSSSSVPVDLKKKVTEEVKVAEGGGQSTTSAAASPANKVFWNKSFTANADVLKAAKSPATGKQQPQQPTMTFSIGGGGGPAKKQAKKGQKAYNPRKHQRFLLWQQKQQQLKLQQQEQQQQLIQQQQQQKNGGGGGFSKNTSSAPTSSSSTSTSAKKPDLEPSHLEVENEGEGGYEDDNEDNDEDELFGVEDLWIKFLDKVSVTSSSSYSSSSLTSPSQPQPLLPLPTTLPTASSSSAATSPSPLLGFSPAPPSAPSSSTSAASEVVTTTTAAAAKSSPKKEEEKGGNNGGASNSSSGTTFAASIAPAYTEAQLREQLPAVVALIARYSDAVDKVPKRGRVFSPENIKEAFPHHLTATFCPPLEGGESLAWSILHWMQADGQELKTSLKTEEIMVKDALLPSKHYLFTITIDCSAAGGCWPPPLEFTFTGVSPAASGGLYLDQPEPPCREEAARAAVSWLADLANLLGQFTQLYIEKTGHLSAEKSRPLKNPATFIKELKKTLSNKAFLRMSPISKKVVSGKGGKNQPVYSCSVFLDRLVTFVGTGERSDLAEANAAQKTVDMLLEMLRTNVLVKEEGYE